MTDAVLSVLDGIAELPLWALALAVALAVAAESSLLVGLVVPGDVIVLLAASGGASVPRAVLLVVAVTAGSVGGEALGYGIGRRWGGRLRASRLGRALGEDRWDRAGRVLHRHGARAVFGARYVAAVHAVLPVAAGTLRMPLRRFLAWSTAGAVTWATLYVVVGAAAGASFRAAGERLAGATLAVVVALALVAAALWFRSHRRSRSTTAANTAGTAGEDEVTAESGGGPGDGRGGGGNPGGAAAGPSGDGGNPPTGQPCPVGDGGGSGVRVAAAPAPPPSAAGGRSVVAHRVMTH